MKALTFEVLEECMPAPRAGMRRQRTLTWSRYVDFKGRLRARALLSLSLSHGADWPLDARYRVTVLASYSTRRARDVDNIAKGPMDAVQGLLWNDDHQVDELRVQKLIGCPEVLTRVMVEIIE